MLSMQRALIGIAAVMVLMLLQSPANAFWGFGGSQESNASGLDLVGGYDRNTVLTLTGRVAVAPDLSHDPVTAELLVGAEKITVVLAPQWYLQDDSLDWKVGSSITVRGSRAQGKDGHTYLLAQWVENPGGGTLVLRSATGRPGWSGGGRGSRQGVMGGSGQMQGRPGAGRMGR